MSARASWTGRSNGRGNYYSDNPAFDLKGDGIADTAYRPNDLIDQVIWRAPAAKLLLNSPAVQVRALGAGDSFRRFIPAA